MPSAHLPARTAARAVPSKATLLVPPSVSSSVPPRFLSESDCRELVDRLTRFSTGGGYTGTTIVSTWLGYIRWARNQITLSGEVCVPRLKVVRSLNGAECGEVWLNETSDAALVAAVRRAERLASLEPEVPGAALLTQFTPEQPVPAPQLFSEATFQLDAVGRTAAAEALMQSARTAGMLSAGYIEVSAHSQALLTSWGYQSYCQYTWARYSVTVRDPKGIGSGWAGVDWPAWDRIKGTELSALALEKCLASRNPVTVEPGRYLTILEPQAVADLVQVFVGNDQWIDFTNHLERKYNERDSDSREYPFYKRTGYPPNDPFHRSYARLGERVVDERITISSDPMDPDLGFPAQAPHNWWLGGSFDLGTDVYHPVTWIDRGVLTNLSYQREYAVRFLGKDTGLPNEGAFRMSGGTASIDEMIASTQRGLLVSRFDQIQEVEKTLDCKGYTRDGVWLIENGKISKPAKNFLFRENVLTVLNRVDQLGVPQRVFNPLPAMGSPRHTPRPIVVPPLKVRDFNFVALSDAV